MEGLPPAKETITYTTDYKHATITNSIGQKYAHKLLQDEIKKRTKIKGYWTFWHEYTDDNSYHYTIDNPLMKLMSAGYLPK